MSREIRLRTISVSMILIVLSTPAAASWKRSLITAGALVRGVSENSRRAPIIIRTRPCFLDYDFCALSLLAVAFFSAIFYGRRFLLNHFYCILAWHMPQILIADVRLRVLFIWLLAWLLWLLCTLVVSSSSVRTRRYIQEIAWISLFCYQMLIHALLPLVAF